MKRIFSLIYLSPPIHVGAFFPGKQDLPIPYTLKKNICVLSNDSNEFKETIKNKLKEIGIKCFDSYPISHNEFVKLQQEAKWTISFGEGWDGYTKGQFRNGGIGFGVMKQQFKPDYFDETNLPKFMFKHYEEMEEKILDFIKYFDNEEVFESENKKILELMKNDPNENSLDKIKIRWKNYYKLIGLL